MAQVHTFKRYASAVWIVVLFMAFSGNAISYEPVPGKYLAAAQQFADTFIKYGRDTYGPRHTPLFADFLHVNTKECYKWIISDAYQKNTGYPREWINANFSLDQQFLITLRELGKVSGDSKYTDTAREWAAYALEHCVAPSGLGYWGTHACWDLLSDKYVGHTGDTSGAWPLPLHEMKRHSLDFDYLHTINPQAVERYISRYMAVSIKDWRLITFTRHLGIQGEYADAWDKAGAIEPDIASPFEVPTHAMFGDVVNPFIYWPALYYAYTGDERAWRLAEVALKRFKDTRHPGINLCAGQYAFGASVQYPEASNVKPESQYYGRHMVTDNKHYEKLPIYLMIASEKLPPEKRRVFLDFVKDQYLAFVQWHVNPENRLQFWTDLDIKTGKPQTWAAGGRGASELETIYPTILYGLVRAYRLTGESRFWPVIRSVVEGYGLGDIGTAPGENMNLKFEKYEMVNTRAVNLNAFTVHALVELYHATGVRQYLNLAAFTADEIVKRYFVNGLFILGDDRPWAQIRDHGALACLDVEAALQGMELNAASKISHDGYGLHVIHQETGDRTTDDSFLFQKTAAINRVLYALPAAPASVAVSPSANTVTVTWTGINGAKGYKLERRNDMSGVLYKLIAAPAAGVTTYTDDAPGSKPQYRIRAYNDNSYSPYAFPSVPE